MARNPFNCLVASGLRQRHFVNISPCSIDPYHVRSYCMRLIYFEQRFFVCLVCMLMINIWLSEMYNRTISYAQLVLVCSVATYVSIKPKPKRLQLWQRMPGNRLQFDIIMQFYPKLHLNAITFFCRIKHSLPDASHIESGQTMELNVNQGYVFTTKAMIDAPKLLIRLVHWAERVVFGKRKMQIKPEIWPTKAATAVNWTINLRSDKIIKDTQINIKLSMRQ